MRTLSKQSKKLLAIVLSMAMIITAVPIVASAQTMDLNETESVVDGSYDKELDAEPISEIEELRSANEKRFLMSDRSIQAVIYSQPVHYEQDGKWVDIDNSLVSSVASDTEDIDGYINKSNDVKIKIAKNSNSEKLVSMKSKDYSISWGYADSSKVKQKKVNLSAVENKKVNDIIYDSVLNNTQTVRFNGIEDNYDLEYVISGQSVKENIIINAPSDAYTYSFDMQIKNLDMCLREDGSIECVNSSNEVIYRIPAPYMYDSNYEFSNSVTYSLEQKNKNKYTLTITADSEWINQPERAFPVIIDPVVTTETTRAAIDTTFVTSGAPNTNHSEKAELIVGKESSEYGNCRTLAKFVLPELNSGDMVVDARMCFAAKASFYASTTPDLQVNAYMVTESWSKTNATWSNCPDINSLVLDYDFLSREDVNDTHWKYFNITKAVKQWYEGKATNHGIMLKSYNENGSYADTGVKGMLWSERTPTEYSNAYPVIQITYRNNKGIEGYWTYSSFSVGDAGTAYINDYTGNLVFVQSDSATAGGPLPASVEHVYNNYMADTRYSKTTPYVGKGWRLNIQQTLLSSSEFGLTGDSKEQYPYVYTDADGTDHYFYKKTEDGSTKYYDEDGLGLELTIGSNGNKKYTIKDDKNNRWEFNTDGLLTKILDSNSNYIKINFADDKKTISTVQSHINGVDSSNDKYITFTEYDTGSHYINKMTDPSGRVKTFMFTDGRLREIKNPDGTRAYFTYDSAGSITSVTASDGYKVEFSYSSATSGKKVTEVREYGASSGTGQKITFDRTEYNTTVITTSGNDGIFGNADDVVTTCQFDEFGRTMSLKKKTSTADLGAAVYTYSGGTPNSTASNIKNLNRVTSEYSTGSNAVNIITNSSAETSSNWTATQWRGDNTFTAGSSSTRQYFGAKSMKLTSTAYSGTSAARVYQELGTKAVPGKSYTASAYVRVTSISSDQTLYGAGIAATTFRADGTVIDDYASSFITSVTDEAINNGWRRVYVTFTVPEDSANTRIHLFLRGATGTAYFDGIQVEQYTSVNNYNMLENASFESYNSNGLPTGWGQNALTVSDGNDWKSSASHKQGSYSFRIRGEALKTKELYQTVSVSGTEDDTYIVSGWAKADSVPENSEKNRRFKISTKVIYTDGTYVFKTAAEFNRSLTEESGWQYSSATFNLSDGTSAEKTPESITVYLRYYRQANSVWFDNIQLIKDNSQSYTYDSDGNLVSVAANAKKQSTMEYSNSDLTKSIDAKGYAYEYTYDSKHNMTKAKSQKGITYNYTYDTSGNATVLEVKNTDNTMAFKTEAEYTDNRAYVNKVIDADNNEISYTYDDNSGRLKDVTDSTGKTIYSYKSSNDALLSVTKDDSTVSYTYDDTYTKLKTIDTATADYSLTYDEFSNRTKTKVGAQTLAEYQYTANNGGKLTKLTYGNGDYLEYTYNSHGINNVISQNGSEAFRYYSDRSGAITRQKDSVNDLEHRYVWDTTGRFISQTTVDTDTDKMMPLYDVEYGYDENNNVNRVVDITPRGKATTQYTYGKDNLLETATGNGLGTVNYTYDGLGRNTYIKLIKDDVELINTHYMYQLSSREADGDTVYRTGMISTEQVNDTERRYYYDAAGNIIKINLITRDESGNVASTKKYEEYTYDSMNQLVSVINHISDKKEVYDYDTSGNIVKVSKYKVTDDSDVLQEVINYKYEDSNWGDKLTTYKGQAITYDEIGNPLSYRDGISLEWSNGRQLTKYTKGSNVVQNSYDDSGMRVSKTVNGEKHTYQYVDGKLMYERRGDKSFIYYYDGSSTPYAVRYRSSESSTGAIYYYERNWRGDVTGLYTSSGVKHASYEYDVWGNVTSITDANGNEVTGSTKIAILNPFRYRGYYYDTDMGLYYLQSRYYDAVTHRFVNADSLLDQSFVLGYNLFAYCFNNPVNYSDATGLKCICLTKRVNTVRHKCENSIDSTIVSAINPDSPPDHPDYTPPKKGGKTKVKNPNGKGWGWPAKDGGVWVPTPKMHGGEGWTVQYPRGGHSHAYPGGGVRNHFESEQPTGESIVMIFGGALITAVLIADDATGIGAADDPLLVGSTACFMGGFNGLFGKKVCTVCGEVKYGY